MQALHRIILKVMPACRLWFLDGKNAENRTVSNPNIGYGLCTRKYAGGKTREFYQVGVSSNTTGISVYILGIEDKKYLPQTYARTIGKASVTGYCIKLKALKDIDTNVLEAAIRYGVEATRENWISSRDAAALTGLLGRPSKARMRAQRHNSPGPTNGALSCACLMAENGPDRSVAGLLANAPVRRNLGQGPRCRARDTAKDVCHVPAKPRGVTALAVRLEEIAT